MPVSGSGPLEPIGDFAHAQEIGTRARQIVSDAMTGRFEAARAGLKGALQPIIYQRAGIEDRLRSTDLLARVFAVARACIELGSGGDSDWAIFLCRAMLAELPRATEMRLQSEELARVETTVSFALGQALLRSGRYREVHELADARLSSVHRGILPSYDAAFEVQRASALALQLRLREARSVLERLPALDDNIPGLDLALRLISKYEITRERSVEPFNLEDALRAVFKELDLLGQNVAQWETALMEQVKGTEAEDKLRIRLERLRALHRRLEGMRFRNDLASAEAGEDAQRTLYEFQIEARALLSGDPRLNGLDQQRVSDNIGFATMIEASIAPTSDDLEKAIKRAGVAAEWSERTETTHHLLDALYLLSRLHRRKAVGEDAGYRYALRLYEELKAARRSPLKKESVLSFTGSHRLHFPYLITTAMKRGDLQLAFEALEFRKGMSLTTNEVGDSPACAQEPLGVRTHYASFAVLTEDDPVLFCLRTSTGDLRFHELPVSAADLRGHANALDPSCWHSAPRFGRSQDRAAGVTFQGLIVGLEAAVSEGLVLHGDHLVVAAEDPVMAVPLHLLKLAGKPAFATVSMSRSVSFEDAVRTFHSPVNVLRSMGGVYAPADDEADRDLKRARHYDLLRQYPGGRSIEGTAATVQGVLDVLANSPIAHVMAHGQRARHGQNPIDAAGLRLASATGRIRRTGKAEALLTPGAILAGTGTFPGGHVTLLACVTGLGKRGEAGDYLGFEYALRSKGTASVLASHWHIEWSSAVRFSEIFYDLWSNQGMTRAQAWCNANAASTGDASRDGCPGGAFSLFGDWR